MTQTEITLFTTSDGQVALKVPTQNETVWLNLNQMADLFDRDKSVISRHIKKIFTDKELEKTQAVAFFATTASDGKTYTVEYFNLDTVLSVGYRVNSKRGSEFRKWSNAILKNYILSGFAVNQKRLAEKGLEDLYKSINLMRSALLSSQQRNDIGIQALSIIQNYAKSWVLLLAYDEQTLSPIEQKDQLVNINIESIHRSIHELKKDLIQKHEASDLFGKQRSNMTVESQFDLVHQSFAGELLYPSAIERAAQLFYFFTKNHIFVDGNKRIGSFMFLLYLGSYNYDLSKITNETLVALALLIAESAPKDKEIVIKLITNMLID